MKISYDYHPTGKPNYCLFTFHVYAHANADPQDANRCLNKVARPGIEKVNGVLAANPKMRRHSFERAILTDQVTRRCNQSL
jgi:hypothetical protein